MSCLCVCTMCVYVAIGVYVRLCVVICGVVGYSLLLLLCCLLFAVVVSVGGSCCEATHKLFYIVVRMCVSLLNRFVICVYSCLRSWFCFVGYLVLHAVLCYCTCSYVFNRLLCFCVCVFPCV